MRATAGSQRAAWRILWPSIKMSSGRIPEKRCSACSRTRVSIDTCRAPLMQRLANGGVAPESDLYIHIYIYNIIYYI